MLVDAEVVVDVTNSPSYEDAAELEFFEKSSRNLLAADAGAGHHVALSIVGADRILIAAIHACESRSGEVDPVRRNNLNNRPRYAVL